jgi:hypothetical protein
MLNLVWTIIYSFSTLDNLFNIVLSISYTLTWVCINCIELCNVYWHQKARIYSVEVHSPMSKSFLYSWPLTYKDILKISKASYSAWQDFILMSYFFTSVYSGLKCYPFLLDITGIQTHPCNFRNTFPFTATCKNSPSAGRVLAANLECKMSISLRNPLLL